MRTRYYIALAAGACALGIVVWLSLPAENENLIPEPIYDGKPLDVWLIGYCSVEHTDENNAVEMTLRAGTNALPTIIRMLQAHDPPLKRHVMDFIETRSSYRIRYTNSLTRNCAAIDACKVLGEKAKPAIPALAELLHSDDEYVRSYASNALTVIDAAVTNHTGSM